MSFETFKHQSLYVKNVLFACFKDQKFWTTFKNEDNNLSSVEIRMEYDIPLDIKKRMMSIIDYSPLICNGPYLDDLYLMTHWFWHWHHQDEKRLREWSMLQILSAQ